MRNRKLALLLVIVVLLSALSGCVRRQNDALAAQVAAIMEARGKGVNGADAQTYLATVLPSDAVLEKEESNLIRAARGLVITDFTMQAGHIRKTDAGCTADITQTYTIHSQKHACSFSAAFVYEAGKLYYDGPAFMTKQNNRVRVCYLAGREDLAEKVLNAESEILDRMRDRLGFTPAGEISVKLFDDQAVFLQSIKLDLPQWVGGWHEYGEAVKTFVGAYGTEVDTYIPMLCHESTHRMVSELSADNAAYWLQEGLAGVYQEKLMGAGAVETPPEEASEVEPYATLKTINLEKLGTDNQGAVVRYYASSKAYASFLVDNFGWDKVKQAIQYMQKFDCIPVTGAEKLDETNARTDEAFSAVFGFSGNGAIQDAFDQWLSNKK